MKGTTEEQSLNKPSSMDLESRNHIKKTKKPFYKRPCCGITTAIILLLLITLIILIFTVFKVREPTIKVLNTTVSGVAPRVSFPVVRIELNITLHLVLSVRNPNYVSFKHGSGQSQVLYQGVQVGDVDVQPGNIGSRSTERVESKLTLEADKFDMGQLIGDVVRGQLSFEVRTRVPGRATILGFIKRHVVSVSTCEIDIGIPSFHVIKECKSKAKL